MLYLVDCVKIKVMCTFGKVLALAWFQRSWLTLTFFLHLCLYFLLQLFTTIVAFKIALCLNVLRLYIFDFLDFS